LKKIPVNIISGFLGSGKTTAIIQLLEQKNDEELWAIVINEFGKISIDSQTIRSASLAGTIYDISGGCICCSARGYFYENLTKIVQAGNYSRIIIEPSGLGGIDTVSEMIGLIPQLSLMPIIGIVDIMAIENLRLQMNMIYKNQISKAELIIFSKCDLVNQSEQERLIEKFITLFPDKQDSLAYKTNLLTSILNKDAHEKVKINQYRMFSSTNPGLSDRNYQQKNYSFNANIIFDLNSLTSFLIQHPFIIRGKGHIRTENGWVLVNYTLSGRTFEPCQENKQSEIIIIAEKSSSDHFQNLRTEIERSFISVPT
jgi:G3E family GTPase